MKTKPTLRPYQKDDFASVIDAFDIEQVVFGRAPTGSGKAMLLAALAEHGSLAGRVMVLADMKRLVQQLAGTIGWYTGKPPGIEMGLAKASNSDGFFGEDKIVVSTVQTQYSGEPGSERYRRFDPNDFSLLLLDEAELFLAEKAREVVEWYKQNPNLRVFGTSATIRNDGIAMGELFKRVAFNRDLNWGIRDGWLVPAVQAFVRVAVDFSTLQVKGGSDGEEDFVESEVAARIADESVAIELAKGISHVCGDKKTIVVLPSVDSAKMVADYLCAEKPGCARCIYGEMDDEERDALFDGHKNGDFQYLTSVSLLVKGFDDPTIEAVVNCRKTKSKRWYTQLLGRGARPLSGVVDGPATADERRAAIAASTKPTFLMVNMVGVSNDVRDVTVLDVLGDTDDDRVLDRAKDLMMSGASADEAMSQAAEEVERDREDLIEDAEDAAAELDAIDEAQLLRTRIHVQATVEVDYENDLAKGGIAGGNVDPALVPTKQLGILRKFKVPEADIAKMTPETIKSLSRKLIARASKGLCSYGQAAALRKCGYSKDEVAGMSRKDASAALDQLKQGGWKRRAA